MLIGSCYSSELFGDLQQLCGLTQCQWLLQSFWPFPADDDLALRNNRLAKIPAGNSGFIYSLLPCNDAQVKTKITLDISSQNGTDAVIHVWGLLLSRTPAQSVEAGGVNADQQHMAPGLSGMKHKHTYFQ